VVESEHEKQLLVQGVHIELSEYVPVGQVSRQDEVIE
jgi:hypothetical protein